MKTYNRDIGFMGEKLAVNYLVENGYKIIEKNFKCKTGEIDIIAEDNSYIAFIEVKARYNNKFGMPCEAVTKQKQYKIYKTAEYYILIKKIQNFNFRFDVIEIMLNYEHDTNYIRLIKNAFML